MAQEIDNRIVQMTFDNGQFEKGVSTTLKSLDELDKALEFKDADKSFRSLTQSANSVDLSGVTRALEKCSSSFNWLEEIGVGFFRSLGQKAVDFAENVVDAFIGIPKKIISNGFGQITDIINGSFFTGWNKLEQMQVAMRTIMSATVDDYSDEGEQIEDIEGKLEKLMWYADETSYSFTDMTNNIGKFTSQGIKLDTAQRAMIGISNWAAISGQDTNAAARAMYNLSQSLGTGAVQLRDWMSVENANMATMQFKETVLETGVNMGKLKKLADGTYESIEKGTKITAESFRDNLKGGWFDNELLMASLENYGRATEEINDLINSSTDELLASDVIGWIQEYGDVSEDAAAKAELLEKISEETGLTVEDLTDRLNSLTSEENKLGVEAFIAAQQATTLSQALDATKDAASSQWMGIFKALMGDFQQQTTFWTAITNDLNELFVGPLYKAKDFAKELGVILGQSYDTMPIHMDGLAKAFHFITETVTQFRDGLEGIGPSVEDVADVIIILHDKIEKALTTLEESKWVFNLANSFKPVIVFITNAAKGLFSIVQSLFRILTQVIGLGKDVIWGIWSTVSNLFEIFNESYAIEKFFKAIDDVFFHLHTVINMVMAPIRELVNKGFEVLRNSLSTIVKVLSGPFIIIWKAFSFLVEKVILPASIKIRNVLQSLGEVLGGKLSSASVRFQKIWGRLTPILKQAGAFLSTVFIAVWEELKETFTAMEPIFTSIWETIKDIFSKIGDKIGNVFDKIKKVLGLGGNPFTNMQLAITEMFRSWKKEEGGASKMHEFFEGVRESLTGTEGILTKVKDKLVQFKDFISSKWESGGKDTFTAAIEKIKNAFEKIKEFGGNAIDKVKEFFKSFSKQDETAEGAKTLEDSAEKVNVFAKALEFLKNVAEKAVELLKKVVRYILDTLGGEGASVADVIKGIGSGQLMVGMAQLSNSLGNFMDNIGELAGKITGKHLDTRTGLEKFADAISSIAKSIAIVLVAFAVVALVIGRYSPEELLKITSAITAFLGVIYVFMAKAKDIDLGNTDTKDILVMALAVMAIATAMASMVKAIKKLSSLTPEELKTGVLGLVAIVGAIALLGIALKDKSFTGSKRSFSSGGGLSKKELGGILSMALSVYIIAMAMSKIAKLATKYPDGFKQATNTMIGMLVGIAAIALIFKENSILGSNGDFKDIGTGILAIAAGMLVMSAAISVLGKLERGQFSQGIEGIITLMIMMVATAALLKKVDGKNFLTLAAGLAVMAVALNLLVPAIAAMGVLPWSVLGKGFAAVAAGLLLFIGAAWLAGKVVPGLTALSVLFLSIGGMVFLIGAGLALIASSVLILALAMEHLTVTGVAGMTAFVLMLDILLDGLAGLVVKIATFAVELFVTFIEGLSAQVSRLVPAVVTILKAILDGIYELTPSLMAALMALGEMLIVLLKTFLIDILDSITEALPHLEALLETIITLAITLIANGLTTLITMLLDFIIDVLNAIAEKTPDIVDAVGNIIVAVIEGIGRLAPEVVTALLAAANMWLDALVDAFDPNNDSTGSVSRLIEATIQLIWNIIGCFLKALGDVIDIGAQMIGALWDGLFGDGLENEENSDKLVWKIIRAITDAVSKAWEELKNVGRRIWNALFGGMTNAAEEEKIGENVGRNVQKGYERVTKTNSPSKLFEWEGKMLDLGLAKGVEENQGTVVTSLEGLRDAITGIFSNSAGIIQSLIDGEFSDPTIRPTLDLSNVISGANGIGSLFDDNTIGVNSLFDENGNISGLSDGSGVTFIQNNYSPKELSRLEIYRQTKNQLSTIKGVVNGA